MNILGPLGGNRSSGSILPGVPSGAAPKKTHWGLGQHPRRPGWFISNRCYGKYHGYNGSLWRMNPHFLWIPIIMGHENLIVPRKKIGYSMTEMYNTIYIV